MRVQTKYLDTFVTAFEAGSFTRAAEALHVTPSTVSYQIRQLEDWLGAPLFERSARRVLPTALGERLHADCARFIDALQSLRQGLQGGGAARSVLRIATGSSFGRYVLTPILARPEFAGSVIDLRFGTDDEVARAVADGRADLGFSYTVSASNTLRFDLVYRYELVLIAPADARPPARVRGLAGWIDEADFIAYDDCETTFARWFQDHLGAMPKRLRSAGRCSEIEESIALVRAGRGLSIVPRHMLSQALDDGTVRIVGVPNRRATHDTVYRVGRVDAHDDDTARALHQAVLALGSG